MAKSVGTGDGVTGNRKPLALRQWALLGILLLAFGLRVYRLDSQSLWYDETVSTFLASENLPALVAHTAHDIHPPGYYVLLRGWALLVGQSQFAFAYFSVFFGLLLVALVYWLAQRVFGAQAGLLAALLVAISPYNLWYSQEVRMYTLGAALGLGALGAILRLLAARPGRLPPWTLLVVYVLCAALGLWVLYYFAFLLVVLNLMVAVWWLVSWRGRQVGWAWLGRWVLAQGAVALLYAPWLPVAWRQATVPPVPPWRGFTPLGPAAVQVWSALSLGQSVQPARVWPVLVLVAVLFLLGLLAYRGRPRFAPRRTGHPASLPWFLGGYALLPVLLIYLASFLVPLYHVRYAFTYSPPFYAVVAAGLAWLWRKWRPAMIGFFSAILVLSAVSINAYHADFQYASDDHRAATHFLAERWRPGDAILVNAGYVYTALVYYWNGDPIGWRGRLVSPPGPEYGHVAGSAPVVLQTGTVGGDPSLGWGSPAADFYAMSEAETAQALAQLFAAFDRVWIYRCYDTVTDPDGFIRGWLDEHGTQFEDQVFTGESQLRVQGFLTGRDPLVSGQAQDAALADGSLRLLANTALPTSLPAGSGLDLALSWTVGTMPADERILFAGLFDQDGQRWAQTDERPLGSLYPVAAWPQGEIVRTPLRIQVPSVTPPGRYRLEVGWYRFVDAQPIWLPWTTGNLLYLGDVDVTGSASLRPPSIPALAESIGVSFGQGVWLVGINAGSLTLNPGEAVQIELLWQGLDSKPQGAPAVLQLVDAAGQVTAEDASPSIAGGLSFADLAPGQVISDRRSLAVPPDCEPGIYAVLLGRRSTGGDWLAVRRGLFHLGTSAPLVTVRVLPQP